MINKEMIKEFFRKIDIYLWLPVFLVIFVLSFILYDWYPGGRSDILSGLIKFESPFALLSILFALILPTFIAIFLGMYAGVKLKKRKRLWLIVWIIYFIVYVGWLLFLTIAIICPT